MLTRKSTKFSTPKKKEEKKMKALIGMSILLISMQVFGTGRSVGNGGVSHVCREDGNIVEATLLDLFEGKYQYSLKYRSGRSLDVDTIIELSQLRLAHDPIFLAQFQKELAKVKANIVFMPDFIVVLPTNDAFPKIKKKGCQYENVANYTDGGQILVSSEIFKHKTFNNTNRAALYVHEAIYAMARKNHGDTSSVRSRKLTAYLLAKKHNKGVIDQLVEQIKRKPAPKPKPRPKYPWAYQKIASGYYNPMANICSFRIVKEDGVMHMIVTGSDCEVRGQTYRMTCNHAYCYAETSIQESGYNGYTCNGKRVYNWYKTIDIAPISYGIVKWRFMLTSKPFGRGTGCTFQKTVFQL